MVKAVLNRRFLPSLVSPEPRFIKRERERESHRYLRNMEHSTTRFIRHSENFPDAFLFFFFFVSSKGPRRVRSFVRSSGLRESGVYARQMQSFEEWFGRWTAGALAGCVE